MMAWEVVAEVVGVRLPEEVVEAEAEAQRLLELGDLVVVVVEQGLQVVAGAQGQKDEKVAVVPERVMVPEFWMAALGVAVVRQQEEVATWMEVLMEAVGKQAQAKERCSDEVLELVVVVPSSLRLQLGQEWLSADSCERSP